jgi:hypothetical protein
MGGVKSMGMVLIWLALLGLMILGFVMSERSYCFDIGWFVLALISGCILFIALVIFPINHIEARSFIIQYYAAKETINQSRQAEISDIERATLTNTITTINAEIANYQYWNKTIFDIYIPDEVMELELLK